MQSAINDAGVVAGFARHSRNETIGGQQRNSYSHKGKRSLNRFCTVRKRIVALFFDTQHMGGGGKMPACTSMLTRLCAVGLDGCSLMTPAQSPPSPSLCYCCQLLVLQLGYSDLCEECCNCIIAREKRVLLSISRLNYEGATQQQRGALLSSPKVKNTHFPPLYR